MILLPEKLYEWICLRATLGQLQSFPNDSTLDNFLVCLKTANCRKQLDSTNATEHDDELFCKSCYGKKFGPKGYGYGGGAGVLSMDDGTGYKVLTISNFKKKCKSVSS